MNYHKLGDLKQEELIFLQIEGLEIQIKLLAGHTPSEGLRRNLFLPAPSFYVRERTHHFSCVQLFETPWTIAHQVPLSSKFSRQEHWSGLPCPPPGIFLTLRLNSCFLRLLHWQAGSLSSFFT